MKRITLKQRLLARSVAENYKTGNRKKITQLVLEAGYSSKVADRKPGKILDSYGVKAELKKLGFSEFNAKRVVAEIMNNPKVDPNARLKATDQTFKIHGTYAPEKSLNVNINANAELREKSKLAIADFLNENPRNT